MKRPFIVTVNILKTVKYEVDANTSEEAEAIAEDWVRDGEPGAETSLDIESSEAIPAEEFGSDLIAGEL